uniref:TATA box-binding protein-associated factor RNA polymerase I subunit C n=1 Tax=Panthera tigris altaica TaxID=74533 RepID=A0A8C9KT36_PANTA
MDFPGSLPPTLFRTGPLGVSNTPDLSFMCSWRDALTLPEPLAQNSQVRIAGRALAATNPFPSLTVPSDPWDPGVTARDLLFRGGIPFRRKPRAVLDVTEQLSRFLWDHGDIAFAPLGKLMLENFKLEGARSHSKKKTVVSVKSLLQDLGGHQPWGSVSRGAPPPSGCCRSGRGPQGSASGEGLRRAALRGGGRGKGEVS